ncbi:CPBP family intramembrane metalloprotease [Lutimonas saemankumensis]|uniref:CPBP family intramembrane glutamic endopeptidase n=1 Tax=Lutimonas saemankumensis TaxID=483016 RepID=UPI001CD71F0C|nr:CPBP family intramembrane glutamic endopeptidase [Lutimonas saemankumensis]MCA0931365.1 CPBP family intramembrane metalloprotease [Lutimonas saemankumensis]
MLGVFVVFILSWLVLWIVFREHITSLGILPNLRRLREFSIGLLIMAVFCAINLLGQSYLKEVSYIRNPEYGFLESLNGIWWTLKAALFEELIFRGALLYILIKKFGIIRACMVSAVVFGIYHWFSYDMFGRGLVPMIYVFLVTGVGGWMFAYAFARTQSLYAPLGLHFGWIVVSIVVFSAGPLGNSLYIIQETDSELNGWEQLMFFLWQALVIPGLITFYLNKRYSKPQT